MKIPSTDQQPAAAAQFCTEDLALATVLSMHGYDGRLEITRADSRQAEWAFDRDDQLDKVVREYNSGSHLVEPKRFMTALKAVRRNLYRFLDSYSGS